MCLLKIYKEKKHMIRWSCGTFMYQACLNNTTCSLLMYVPPNGCSCLIIWMMAVDMLVLWVTCLLFLCIFPWFIFLHCSPLISSITRQQVLRSTRQQVAFRALVALSAEYFSTISTYRGFCLLTRIPYYSQSFCFSFAS